MMVELLTHRTSTLMPFSLRCVVSLLCSTIPPLVETFELRLELGKSLFDLLLLGVQLGGDALDASEIGEK